jgi:F0F1-type ATP synthase membrane subunit b/b'
MLFFSVSLSQAVILDAETQVLVGFVVFCSTVYNNLGSSIDKFFTERANEISEKLKGADNAVLDQLNSAVQADQQVLSLEEDFKQYCELTDQLAVAQADLLNMREVHHYRETIVKKLDSLHALEDAAVMAIRNRMLNKVKADVVHTFKNDKNVKEAALNRAIELLAGGAKGNRGKDIVGDVFAQALVNYKESYAKQPEGSDPILKQLEKDMAAVAAVPKVEGKGGNVFVTHPLMI